MAIYDPPVCSQCGRTAWSQNPWCLNHPHSYARGTYVTASAGWCKPVEPEVNDDRPSWDETWLECAHVMSRRSRCSRAKVGAVIVADDQTVVSASYNGPPRNFEAEGPCTNWCPRARGDSEPSPTYDDCPSAHAEANAIARADFSRMKGATIYVSTSCCKGCAKLLANSGIKRVVFQSEEGRDYRNPQETIDFLRECGIEVSEV